MGVVKMNRRDQLQAKYENNGKWVLFEPTTKCRATIDDGDPVLEPCPHRTERGGCTATESCYYNDIEDELEREFQQLMRERKAAEAVAKAAAEDDDPMAKQAAFCKANKIPMFAPRTGICWSCHQQIPDRGDEHITGCPLCCRTYCD